MTVLMTPDQLVLFATEPSTNGNGAKRKTVRQAGLHRDAAPGPERLLRALVKRGLGDEHLPAAAALVLALDETRRNGGP